MKISGEQIKDIHMISCLVQDSITMMEWINHKNKVFDIFLNRFCWEDKHENKEAMRTNSILIITNVDEAKVSRAPAKKNIFKTLLSCLCSSKEEIYLTFDELFEIKLTGKNMIITLEDITEKWNTDIIPFHALSKN